MSDNLLGEYLRARRRRVRPEEVGLPPGANRRVEGLRREEVAILAGISVEYYLRLEQGRDRNPSVQVVDALARVLGLDAAGTNYLVSLSQPHSHLAGDTAEEVVSDSIRCFIEDLETPAFVVGRAFDILASNAYAQALSPLLAPGRNRLRSMFLSPQERERHLDWQSAAARMVANARDHFGYGLVEDAEAQALIDELKAGSETFADLWALADVADQDVVRDTFHHPLVGDLTLDRTRLAVTGADRQDVIIYHCPTGSEGHQRLSRLVPSTSSHSPGGS